MDMLSIPDDKTDTLAQVPKLQSILWAVGKLN